MNIAELEENAATSRYFPVVSLSHFLTFSAVGTDDAQNPVADSPGRVLPTGGRQRRVFHPGAVANRHGVLDIRSVPAAASIPCRRRCHVTRPPVRTRFSGAHSTGIPTCRPLYVSTSGCTEPQTVARRYDTRAQNIHHIRTLEIAASPLSTIQTETLDESFRWPALAALHPIIVCVAETGRRVELTVFILVKS